MYDENSQYDYGVNTFSPDGRIYQIEYAINASKLGSSGLGIATESGVVLVVEKRQSSKLIERSGFEKVNQIDSHIMCLASGLIADAQELLEHARHEAQYHKFTYDTPIDLKPLGQMVADLALNFGEGDITTKRKPIARPYGVSLLFGGIDETGPKLFETDPSGTLVGYLAKGVGQAKEAIQVLLEKHYDQKHDLNKTIIMALSVLKQTMEEKMTSDTVEVFIMCTQMKQFKKLSTQDIDKFMPNLIDMSQ